MNKKTIPEFHQVEPRLSLAHFPPVEATIDTVEDAVQFVCKSVLNQSYHERVIGIYCDTKNHPVCYSILSEGTENYAMLNIQSVLTPALLYGVSRIILLHNHPSGDGMPSQKDYDFSYTTYRLCEDFGIVLLDSIIMPCGQTTDNIRFISIASEEKPGNPWHRNRIKMWEKNVAETGNAFCHTIG